MEKIKELLKSKVFVVSFLIISILVLLSVFFYKKWKEEREALMEQKKAILNDLACLFAEKSEELNKLNEGKKKNQKPELEKVDDELLESYMWNVKEGRLSQREAARVSNIPLSTFTRKYHKYLELNK
jgi:nuclear transport factor 2 (NTF2) superfamily protein